ncbi:muscle M-line assembly protein unc-89-like [Argopecten irradians]|uniref:muscle M-line assembly protein unc-89-like n=1 Tax=Argopecten irradians TaxID=31199 RepID=UPI00372432F8
MDPLSARAVYIWITLVVSSKNMVASSVCPEAGHIAQSVADFTDVDIGLSLGDNCTWVIESTNCEGDGGVEVKIYLHSFIRTDEIYLYDGPSSKYPAILTGIRDWGRIYQLPSKRSSGRFITVEFVVRRYRHRRRIQLLFRDNPKGQRPSLTLETTSDDSSEPEMCDTDIVMAARTPSFITFPEYLHGVGSSLDCTWIVVSDDVCNDDVILVRIHTLSLDDDDHLVFYDGRHEYAPTLADLSGLLDKEQVIMGSKTEMSIRLMSDETGTARGFRLSYVRMKATPSLAESVTTTITENMAVLSADFISPLPHTAVFWSKDGVLIKQDIRRTLTVTSAKVNVDSQPGVKVDGFKAWLMITDPKSHDFGVYKVAVRNRFGISERESTIQIEQAAPVIKNYTMFPENATIMVTFTSPSDFKVQWYKTGRRMGTGIYITTVGTETNDENEAVFTSTLYLDAPTELYYGDYKCVIKSNSGTAEVTITLEFPKTEIPQLSINNSPVTTQTDDGKIILSVNFASNIAHPTAIWYHGSERLYISYKYDIGLTWKGMSESEWHLNGYPPRRESGVFEPITLDSRDVDNADSYIYPPIGRARDSTDPNSYYSAYLTISYGTLEDLGLYRVMLKNDAGIYNYVIDVPAIEVFPYVTCDQGDTIQLVCNVTSCSDVTLSWIHSVDDVVIRKLPGNQDGTINTLTIPMCMYSDAGTYVCVGTAEEPGSDVAIRHHIKYDNTVIDVRAIPVILNSTVDVTNEDIVLAIHFFSNPPPRLVTWYLNGNKMGLRGETAPYDVRLPMHDQRMLKKGYINVMSVPRRSEQDFGTYTVKISNEIGSSEHSIYAGNPQYAKPVTSSHVTISFNGSSATLQVTFSSYYAMFNVKWYFSGQHIRGGNSSSKYILHTDSSSEVPDSSTLVRTEITKSTHLVITCLSEEDYGIYDVIVSTPAGQAVIPVRLTTREQNAPLIIGAMASEITASVGMLSASFYSPTGYNLIKWLREEIEISNDTSKYSILNEPIDVEISGEMTKKTGTKTRLNVTSLTILDFGTYTVQIYNEYGMTESTVTLRKDCALYDDVLSIFH